MQESLLVPLQSRAIIQQIKAFNQWDHWFPSTRNGDTAIGKALEDFLGIKENNLAEADRDGVEFKGARFQSKALLTLFTRNPSYPERAVHALVEELGTMDSTGTTKRLNTNLAYGRFTTLKSGKPVTINVAGNHVHVLSGLDVLCGWRRDVFEEAAKTKLHHLVLVQADTRKREDGEHFRYRHFEVYEEFDLDAFYDCVREGEISVHFRVKGRLDACRNRGTAFRIRKSSVAKIYKSYSHLTKSVQ